MAFQAELLLEGVDDRLDPLAHLTQRAEPGRLISPVGPDQPRVQPRQQLLEPPTCEALVGQDDHARAQDLLVGGLVQQPLGDLALAGGGLAKHQATGTPSGLVSTYSLRPQYQREWLWS